MTSNRITELLKSTYVSKGTDFSVSQLTNPSYQLWVEFNASEKVINESVGFKSFLGSAMHKAFEVQNLKGVVQEFSYTKKLYGFSIGGTADRLDFIRDQGMWQLGDYKLKGAYSYKKFIEGEVEKETMQMSIYRWLFEDLFLIMDEAIIFLFMPGHSKREKYPEFQEAPLTLLPIENVEEYLIEKIKIVTGAAEPEVDCDTKWLCDYCDYKDQCPYQQRLLSEGFGDES